MLPAAQRAVQPARAAAGELMLTALGDVRLLGRLGEGGRSTVHAGEWRGRPVAVKVYKHFAVQRHARKHPVSLARYEFERNRAFHAAPGLSSFVAEPLAFLDAPGVSALVQERLDGRLYYFHFIAHERRVDERFMGLLARLLELAHAAGLYDVDLHAMNVMVVDGPDGEPWPKLFDFNLIPFHVRPPNPLIGLLLATGLWDARARDLRKLRRFHDFSRVERKLLRFYPG